MTSSPVESTGIKSKTLQAETCRAFKSSVWRLLAVAANRFHRAAFHGFLALRFFLRGRGLLVDVGVPTVIITGEILRSSLAAQVAIDALVVHVVCAHHVLRVFIFQISHKLSL